MNNMNNNDNSNNQNFKSVESNDAKQVVLNESYEGEIVKILSFGAFVQLNGITKQGLIHISKISKSFVKDIHSVVQVGDKVLVKVIEINQKHQINLELIKKVENE